MWSFSRLALMRVASIVHYSAGSHSTALSSHSRQLLQTRDTLSGGGGAGSWSPKNKGHTPRTARRSAPSPASVTLTRAASAPSAFTIVTLRSAGMVASGSSPSSVSLQLPSWSVSEVSTMGSLRCTT
jgi:hypothetical protein